MRNALERADETARWPEGEFHEVALALYAAGLGAAYRVMEVLAAGLELPAGFFRTASPRRETSRCAFCTTPLDCCRVSSAQLGAGAHHDYGSITLRSRMKSAASSCSARTAPGQQAPPVQGAAVINTAI